MAKPPTNPADLMDHLLKTDADLRRLLKKVHRQQNRLERVVEPESYRLYLRLEETAIELCFELVERVWAVAHSRGRPQRGQHARW